MLRRVTYLMDIQLQPTMIRQRRKRDDRLIGESLLLPLLKLKTQLIQVRIVNCLFYCTMYSFTHCLVLARIFAVCGGRHGGGTI
jgi:hypothetical protein